MFFFSILIFLSKFKYDPKRPSIRFLLIQNSNPLQTTDGRFIQDNEKTNTNFGSARSQFATRSLLATHQSRLRGNKVESDYTNQISTVRVGQNQQRQCKFAIESEQEVVNSQHRYPRTETFPKDNVRWSRKGHRRVSCQFVGSRSLCVRAHFVYLILDNGCWRGCIFTLTNLYLFTASTKLTERVPFQ